MKSDSPKSIARRAFDVLSGFGLATVLLVLLMILTWLATLEQVQHGLYPTLEKYFNYREAFAFPDAGIISEKLAGKSLPPLPGGFWVCALLALNLTLGGIIRMRKGWRTAGVLIAHFGIIFMIVAGGVAHFKEQRGVMMLREGQTADFAQSLTETAIEIVEIDRDGKVAGKVHEITDAWFKDLENEKRRTVKLPALPFDLELQGYLRNTRPVSTSSMAPPSGEPPVDGWFLYPHKPNTETEMDTPGIHARVLRRDGAKDAPFLLAVASYHPFTVEADGRTFAVQLTKKLWPVPFRVRLEEARAEFHPNTSRPKAFESDITRIEDGREVKVRIEMNEPMRHDGYVFFQRTMEQAQMQSGDGRALSGFEVVRNPADKWPEYSLYISGFGLFVHFVMKLTAFLLGKRSPITPKTT